MTTPTASHSFEAGRPSEDILPTPEVSTAHVSEFNVRDADALNPTHSEHHVTETEPENGQTEVGSGASADLRNCVPQPIDPPEGHPKLNFRPTVLKYFVMVPLMLLFLLVGLSIGILVHESGSSSQFYSTDYHILFIARYIPTITGTITVLLFETIVLQLFRMAPYIAMADYRGLKHGAKAGRSVTSLYFPLPPIAGLNTSMTYFAFASRFFASLLVSVKTALLSTQKYHDGWVITVRREAAWYLVGGYALMALFTFTTTIWLSFRQTGLKWDPATLADKLALFRNHNTLSYFEEIELQHEMKDSKMETLKNARFRLGYWLVEPNKCHPERVWYGIGVLNPKNLHPMGQSESLATNQMGPTLHATDSRTTCELETTNEHESEPSKHSQAETQHESSSTTHREQDPNPGSTSVAQADATENTGHPTQEIHTCGNEKSKHYPYRNRPWIGPLLLAFWVIIVGSSFVVCLYALAAGHVLNGFSMANTWYLHNRSPNGNFSTSASLNQTLYSSDNSWSLDLSLDRSHNLRLYAFVFRVLPTQIAVFFVSFIFTVNINHYFVQTFVEMHNTPGSASMTLLLEYLTTSPLRLPLDALENGHLKVAWFSALSTISPLFPIFVGGMFSMTNTGERIYFEFSIPAFSIVFAFLAVYCISLYFVIWPTKDRLLPRQYYNLAALVALCHKSRFLWTPEFNISDPKTTRQHMVSRIFLREDNYLFGVYNGTDDKKHLGFDVAGNVDWVPPERTDYSRWIRWRRKSSKVSESNSIRSQRTIEDDRASGYA